MSLSIRAASQQGAESALTTGSGSCSIMTDNVPPDGLRYNFHVRAMKKWAIEKFAEFQGDMRPFARYFVRRKDSDAMPLFVRNAFVGFVCGISG